MKNPSLLAAALTLLAAPVASAQPTSDARRGDASVATPPVCSRARSAAISEIACELAIAVDVAAAETVVVAGPVASDVELRDPAGLGARIASLVAGHIRGARAVTEPASLDRAQALAGDATRLVHLEPKLERGELRVTASVHHGRRSFWARVKDPRPAPVGHGFASRRIDAEVQTFLPPVPLVAGAVLRASSPERDVLALACDDLDGDGALELVLVSRRRIHVGRLRGGAFVPHATASWSELSPVSPRPLREPIGSISVAPGRHVDVGISDRERGVRLGPGLERPRGNLAALPWPGGGCSAFASMAVDAAVGRCSAEDEGVPPTPFPVLVDAVSGAHVVDTGGRVALVRAGRASGGDVVLVEHGSGRSARLPGAGAQLAVGDVDRDGAPEIVTSASTLDPSADAVIVHSWHADGGFVERLRVAVPTGVRALAVCPAESSGPAPIVVATTNGVWLVR